MSTVVTREIIAKTRHAIKVFLSAYGSLHNSVKGTNSSIFGVYNLACLMNLPEAMEHFGPLRQLWEGSTKGEGILRFVKPMMTQGFKHQGSWHFHLLQKLGVAKALKNILQPPTAKADIARKIELSSRKAFFISTRPNTTSKET